MKTAIFDQFDNFRSDFVGKCLSLEILRKHKIALKTAKISRIIYYVFSTNTANELLVIV